MTISVYIARNGHVVLSRNTLPAVLAMTICYVLLLTSEMLADPIKPAVPDVARPLPLTAVRLSGGPLKQAQDLTAKYLLELEPDRMMAGYRKRAGLEPKAEGYEGWDAVDGRQLTGHIAGHYLSGVSLMYAATGDERFKERADYLVKEMKEVQDKQGDGYLGALLGTKPGVRQRRFGRPQPEDLTDGKELFKRLSEGEIRSGGFDLNGMWSPWYVLHKTYAGLRDAYRHTGNKTALEVETKFAEWAEKILAPLDDEQIQRMLNTEFGGMNEIFADLYADTGDKRWLDMSYKFEHKSFIEPLKQGVDNLGGKHGNTQVPKLIGSLARYAYIGDRSDFSAARFFWERVADHHSFATGGHGKDEYFGEPDQLNDRVDGRTAETCNVYNMLKLTRRLFALDPNPRYAEFEERALFNHILGSIDSKDGSTCYMVPVGMGVQREYQDMFRSFTCCVGSGMESHALHGDGIYYESGDRLWVNLYAPSTARWEAGKVDLTMNTDFPEGESATATLKLESPKEFTLALRRPAWAGDGFAVTVNGESIEDLPKPESYVEIKREWNSGDTIAVTLPKKLHLEALRDNRHRVAVMWGPLTMAGDLGPARQRERGRGGDGGGRGQRPRRPDVPVFVAADRPVSEWVKPDDGAPGNFRSEGVGRETDVELVPFYRLHRRMYSAYWDVFTPAEWDKRSEQIAAERERLRKLEESTVAYAQPGEMQPERDFNFQGEDSTFVRESGRPGRAGLDWFSFDLPVDSSQRQTLVVTYYSGSRRRESKFKILVGGQHLADVAVEEQKPARFFDAEYPIPAEFTNGKEKVTVRFETSDNHEIGPVFGIRMVRASGRSSDRLDISAPPESFFEKVRERDQEAAREFYKKYLDVSGIPVVSAGEVADQALLRTHEIVSHMLAGRPDVIDAMKGRDMYLIIIGKDQLYTDMPEYRNARNKDYLNERVRGTGGNPTSFGEENLLSLPLDRYDDESIGVHEFCHTIDGALRSIDPDWSGRRDAVYKKAISKGLYKNAYAGSNPGEYWAEIGQSYFDCNRVNNWNHGPVGTREQLKVYDPEGYELCRTTFKLSPEQDWRYSWLQKLPNITPPSAKFNIDPYYTKFTWAREFPVIGREASDEALLKANDTIRKMFAYRHDILKALINDWQGAVLEDPSADRTKNTALATGVKLVVLGKDESIADLPEFKDAPSDGASIDRLSRTFDYSPDKKLLIVGEENVIGDPHRPGVGDNQVVSVFAKAIYRAVGTRPEDPDFSNRGRNVQQYELRVERLDKRFDAKVNGLFEKAIAAGKWKGTTAIHGPDDYWTKGVLVYFNATGQDAAPNDADLPIITREQLKAYDPDLYSLVHETMAYGGHVDWQFEPARP